MKQIMMMTVYLDLQDAILKIKKDGRDRTKIKLVLISFDDLTLNTNKNLILPFSTKKRLLNSNNKKKTKKKERKRNR